MEALLQIMPFVTGMKYRFDRSPDDETSQKKEVDYILINQNKGQPSLAVEQTIVEAFRGQITYLNRSFDIVSKIAERSNRRLPLDRYFTLIVSDALVESLRKRAILRFIDIVTPWVIETAPTLHIDDCAIFSYENSSVHLICGGSHPKANGTIGRIPRRSDDQKNRAVQSLWSAIEHGLNKFSEYKQNRYNTVLCLQDISGEIYPSTLSEIEDDPEKKAPISRLIDYIVVLASVDDRMIVGSVWKEHELRFDLIPFNRRFDNQNGSWLPMK
jgi:hypothetical protein